MSRQPPTWLGLNTLFEKLNYGTSPSRPALAVRRPIFSRTTDNRASSCTYGAVGREFVPRPAWGDAQLRRQPAEIAGIGIGIKRLRVPQQPAEGFLWR
jgi:hypothetical protein